MQLVLARRYVPALIVERGRRRRVVADGPAAKLLAKLRLIQRIALLQHGNYHEAQVLGDGDGVLVEADPDRERPALERAVHSECRCLRRTRLADFTADDKQCKHDEHPRHHQSAASPFIPAKTGFRTPLPWREGAGG